MTKVSCLLSLLSAVVVVASTSPSVQANPPPAAALQTEKVVLLMRHGARSSTASQQIASLSKRAWPDFGLADGQLTAHGRAALLLWGQYYRGHFARQGLLPERGTLTSRQVSTFSNDLQRTIDSADAFLEGLSPGGALPVVHVGTHHWFAPPLSGFHDTTPTEIRQAVVAALGMSLEEAEIFHRSSLEEAEFTFGIQGKYLSSMPWRLFVNNAALRISPLQQLDDMAETVRMQYVNNLPLEEVGFGQFGNQAAVSSLLTLRSLHLDATRHPRFLAVRRGAVLFEKMSASLLHGTGNGEKGDEPLSLYIGHDENFATTRSILGFNWQLPEHAFNDANPGAVVMLERVRDTSNGKRYARISYQSATLDQIRHLSPFGDGLPPFAVTFEPPMAMNSPGANLIPLERFAALAEEVKREAGRGPLKGTSFPEEATAHF